MNKLSQQIISILSSFKIEFRNVLHCFFILSFKNYTISERFGSTWNKAYKYSSF